MIDDLVPAAVSIDGVPRAHNDWGYLMDEKNSLYKYFQKNILNKYPEIKGTVFLPLSSQDYIQTDKGYSVFTRKVNDPKFLSFIEQISDCFEMAFHGIKHEFYSDNGQPTHECANITMEQVPEVVSAVDNFSRQTKISFNGGKFPGYKYNETAIEIIKKLHAKWWALQVNMINKAHPDNNLSFSKQLKVILIPTNVSGDIFQNHYFSSHNRLKGLVKQIIGYKKYDDPVAYLNYLYSNQFPITIQEHFQNQKTNSKRQTPNVYDDIFSLDLIYAFLKGKDVWYATCGEIAHHYEVYNHSVIKNIDNANFLIEYNGIYNDPLLSLKLNVPKIIHARTGTEVCGISKNDSWIFNSIKPSGYRIA